MYKVVRSVTEFMLQDALNKLVEEGYSVYAIFQNPLTGAFTIIGVKIG